MLEEYKRDYEFDTEASNGEFVRVHVTYYYPGTKFLITSASLEPNDLETVEYEVYRLSDQGAVGEPLYDDDGVYDPQDILASIRRIEEEGDY